MSAYLARQMGPYDWEVTKWGDDTRPLEVYQLVFRGRQRWSCNSPGCRGLARCKHVRVIEARRADPSQVPARMIAG